MKKYISVRQEVELSDYVDIDIDIEKHIDEIMEIILNDESLCNKIYIKNEEYKKLKLQYPEIEQYNFDKSRLFIATKDDGSYLITDNRKIFVKEKQNSTLKWPKKKVYKVIYDYANQLDPTINDEKQFTKIEGDFILKFKCA